MYKDAFALRSRFVYVKEIAPIPDAPPVSTSTPAPEPVDLVPGAPEFPQTFMEERARIVDARTAARKAARRLETTARVQGLKTVYG